MEEESYILDSEQEKERRSCQHDKARLKRELFVKAILDKRAGPIILTTAGDQTAKERVLWERRRCGRRHGYGR